VKKEERGVCVDEFWLFIKLHTKIIIKIKIKEIKREM
jgi:hypothetical protein